MAEGHRERLRQRFMNEPIESIPDYVVLEFMLQGAISRKDTCQIARDLLKEFGNLAAVIDAPLSEIVKVPGVGTAAAHHLKMLPMFYRKYAMSKNYRGIVLDSEDRAGEFFVERCIGYDKETVLLACMDIKMKLLACTEIAVGNVNIAEVNIRKILEEAIKYNAARVILAHTHPGGNAFPSPSDVRTTKEVKEVLEKAGIIMDDHIIVAGEYFVSLCKNRF